MNNDPYDGWEGFCHPDAPAGGGGPGFFRSAYPAGMDMDPFESLPHPDSPAARTVLVAATMGVHDATKPPAFLETFASGIGDYSAEELNEALITIFGELSELVHEELFEEAKAIASTILNRHASIGETRQALQSAREERDRALVARNAAASHYRDFLNNSGKYKVQQGPERHNQGLIAAKADAERTDRSLTEARTRLQAASNERIDASFRVAEAKRNTASVTLTDIVTAPDLSDGTKGQYRGYVKGKKDYEQYPSLAQGLKATNHQRWVTAKKALGLVAQKPAERYKFTNLRSNYRGTVTPVKGRVRIGGNDFF